MTRCVLLVAWLCLLTVAFPAVADAPLSRYTFPATGTVYDTRTKLTWQRNVPSTYAPTCSGKYSTMGDSCSWDDAKKYCDALSLASTGWRLPTRAELLTLVDPTKFNPAIDTTAFPSTPSDFFWSSSAYVGSSGYAWRVNLYGGNSYHYDTSLAYRVRCVR